MAIRYDLAQLQPPVKLSNGYLRADAVITKTGVFTYLLPGGKVRRELRAPEEVFSQDTLQSFRLAPLTNNHPAEPLTSKNTKKFQVGTVADVDVIDNSLVKASVQITDEDAIKAAEAGKRQLSCGYQCDLESAAGVTMGITGVPDGIQFDAIQRNIRGNHVALVDRGRAGPEASLHLDADDAVQVDDVNFTAKGKQTMKTIKIDGVDYEVSEQAFQAITKLLAKADAASSDLARVKDDLTKAVAKADQLEADNKEMETKLDNATGPDGIKNAVKARVDLQQKAVTILGDDHELKLDDASDIDIKRAVIIKVSPDAKLDDKDEAYISARFDQAVEGFKPEGTKKKNDALNQVHHKANDMKKNDKADADPVTAARERMKQDNFDAGRKPMNASA
jgi:hypothetical protein